MVDPFTWSDMTNPNDYTNFLMALGLPASLPETDCTVVNDL